MPTQTSSGKRVLGGQKKQKNLIGFLWYKKLKGCFTIDKSSKGISKNQGIKYMVTKIVFVNIVPKKCE